MKVIKYWKPFLAVELNSLYTSESIRPNKSLAFTLCPVKGVLVIFPNKQDSHVSNDS